MDIGSAADVIKLKPFLLHEVIFVLVNKIQNNEKIDFSSGVCFWR